MRVVAGNARGTVLKAPQGEHTRPTTDRVKEAMFSSIQFLLPSALVLDLFAGSGQLGIEAISRGASKAFFVDHNREAVALIRENLKATGLSGQAVINQMEAERFLAGTRERFDIILLDPPYCHGTVEKLLPMLSHYLRPQGVVLCETEPQADLPETAAGLERQKQHRYGNIMITKYRKASE